MGDEEIQIMAAVADWQHVRLLGEDMVATELVLPENHRIGPSDLESYGRRRPGRSGGAQEARGVHHSHRH